MSNRFTLEEVCSGTSVKDTDVLSAATLQSCNKLAALFGKEWVQAALPRSPEQIIDACRDYDALSMLPNSERLNNRWAEGFSHQGVVSQLHALAALQRIATEIELYPTWGDGGPDCRFQSATGSRWVYVELSKRRVSRSAYMVLDDFIIDDYLTDEAKQLPRGEPAVLLLDLTDVNASPDRCAEAVRRRLQPGINTAFGAFAVYSTFPQGGRIQCKGRLLVNPNAASPISKDDIAVLIRMFEPTA